MKPKYPDMGAAILHWCSSDRGVEPRRSGPAQTPAQVNHEYMRAVNHDATALLRSIKQLIKTKLMRKMNSWKYISAIIAT